MGPLRHLVQALDVVGEADLVVLRSPDAAPPEAQDRRIRRRLTLTFNDITTPRAGLVAPDPAAIRALLAYGREASSVVLQCFAGVSRSTAAAYILACQATAPGQEARLAEELRRLSPAATPNPLMVRLADEALGRGGRMARAIEALGRGVEAFEGPVFAWTIGATGAVGSPCNAPATLPYFPLPTEDPCSR